MIFNDLCTPALKAVFWSTEKLNEKKKLSFISDLPNMVLGIQNNETKEHELLYLTVTEVTDNEKAAIALKSHLAAKGYGFGSDYNPRFMRKLGQKLFASTKKENSMYRTHSNNEFSFWLGLTSSVVFFSRVFWDDNKLTQTNPKALYGTYDCNGKDQRFTIYHKPVVFGCNSWMSKHYPDSSYLLDLNDYLKPAAFTKLIPLTICKQLNILNRTNEFHDFVAGVNLKEIDLISQLTEIVEREVEAV